MTCASEGPFEFLTRPYPFKREPFQLGSGELVTYEGIYFSLPASGLLLDKRLFTESSSHPVVSTVKLYINKDAGLGPVIEPDDDGTNYISGTPHYEDYILDLRSLIADVAIAHANDSDHSDQQFILDNLLRNRSVYDLSAYEVDPGQYFHPESINTVPSGATPPGSSGSIQPPGDGFELGAQQIMDLDMDEVLWQVFTRPRNVRTSTPQSVTVEPIFPMVLPNGSIPDFSSLETTNLRQLALLGSTSGGVLLTGDGMFAGTFMKLSTGSGVIPETSGSFVQSVPWKLFPCERELCTYYSPHVTPSSIISALGRQGVFNTPGSISDGVYLLGVADGSSASGFAVQHWPSNYHGTSGIDENGHAHNGVHVVDKLLYDLGSAGTTVAGFSPLNGQKVFVRWVGTEAGSKGETYVSSSPRYANEDTIYVAGKLVNPFVNSTTSTVNWASINNTFSPVNWSTLSTSALGPIAGIFGGPPGVTYRTADVQAGSVRGVVRRKEYIQWGYIDQVVLPDQDQGQGGQRKSATITYHTIQYREGQDSEGNFAWIQQDEFDTTREVSWFDNTYNVNNVFSFFFILKPNNGLVHVNGDVYVQWSDRVNNVDVLPRKNRFAPLGATTTSLAPSTNRTDVVVSVGFFPNWKLVRYVTTNNQVVIPSTLDISPGNSEVITFDPDLDFDTSTIQEFGPPVWDPDTGVNYIYFKATIDGEDKIFFAHMDTDFTIIRINRVDAGILSGRMVLLNI